MERKQEIKSVDERLIGIDMLKIISMLGIVLLHVLGAGGVLKNTSYTTCNGGIAWGMEILALASVNCFAMITGYLYISREKVKYSSLLSLLLSALFYSVAITAVFLACGLTFSVKTLAAGVCPSLAGRYWYITCYTLVFVLIPFMNRSVAEWSEETYRKFLLTIFLIASVIPSLVGKDFFALKNGYSSFWLIICYLYGGYIKKFGFNGLPINRWTLKVCFLIIVCNIAMYLGHDYFLSKAGIGSLADYTTPYVVINALIAMKLFLAIPNTFVNKFGAKVIQKWSVATFGVYLIHCHIYIYIYIYI